MLALTFQLPILRQLQYYYIVKLGQFHTGRSPATGWQTFLSRRLLSDAHTEVLRDDRYPESEVVTVGRDLKIFPKMYWFLWDFCNILFCHFLFFCILLLCFKWERWNIAIFDILISQMDYKMTLKAVDADTLNMMEVC